MATWPDRWRDARAFWDLAQAGRDLEPKYGNAAASNAVLAVIAANDAVCLFVGAKQPRGRSHTEAAKFLQSACKGTAWERDASEKAAQLLDVLRQKEDVQYRGKPLAVDKIERIMKQVGRFLDWAADILPSGGPTPGNAGDRQEEGKDA